MREMRLGPVYDPMAVFNPFNHPTSRIFVSIHEGCGLTVFHDRRITYHLLDSQHSYSHMLTLGNREALRVRWISEDWVVVSIGRPPVTLETGLLTKASHRSLLVFQRLLYALWDTIVGVALSDKRHRR